MNELEELEQEELDAKMLEAPTPAMKVPNVPSHEPGRYFSKLTFSYTIPMVSNA
jgi:charged multivesicular body protein 4